MLYSFITLPDWTQDLLGTTTDHSVVVNSGAPLLHYIDGMFANLLSPALAIAGLVIGVLLVRLFVMKGMLKGVKRLTGRR